MLHDPFSYSSVQMKILAMESPASCCSLDHIAIKGNQSRESIPSWLQTEWIKIFFPLCFPVLQDYKVDEVPGWRSTVEICSLAHDLYQALIKLEHQNRDKDECTEGEKVEKMEWEWEFSVSPWYSLVYLMGTVCSLHRTGCSGPVETTREEPVIYVVSCEMKWSVKKKRKQVNAEPENDL